MLTNYVFLWEALNGDRCWEAVSGEQATGFLQRLLDEGVYPATGMVVYAPIFFYWVWKQFHRGLSDVHFQTVNTEIYRTEPVPEAAHKSIDAPAEKKKPEPKLGWIAPDGRFFGCEYGGHASLARRIVGEMQDIRDPERHLENLGWAKIFKGLETREHYSIGMGEKQKLTEKQVAVLQRMRLDNVYGLSKFL